MWHDYGFETTLFSFQQSCDGNVTQFNKKPISAFTSTSIHGAHKSFLVVYFNFSIRTEHNICHWTNWSPQLYVQAY